MDRIRDGLCNEECHQIFNIIEFDMVVCSNQTEPYETSPGVHVFDLPALQQQCSGS